uniref:Chloride channel protein n=1 Tax=Ascaris lumbricoides TaxID=6252 RepID=A0A0M3IAD7_ASCLU
MLGIITAVLSITMDVAIEYLQHFRLVLYEQAQRYHEYSAFISWILYIALMTGAAALFCHLFARQAVGSGIPEVKVIMHGFAMKNYLTLKTMVAKMVGLTLALGSGLPVGKEGPFVHMGAIVASLLTRMTSACRYQAFFSNEGRRMEMLSSGCAVGIACTFSAPAGGVLYGIESTSKYFAVKNYWRAFVATTCSALIFRFANAAIIPPHIAGTITAYYQTNFPNEVFLVEEVPVFALIGALSGLFGALFVLVHRQIAYFRERNKIFKAIFGNSPLIFTFFMAAVVGTITYPNGIGRYFAGQLTFRETLADFIANCTFSQANLTERGCSLNRMQHWTGGLYDNLHVLTTLSIYFCIYFILVAICVSLEVPAGIFVPSFVIGACGGRIIGEVMAIWFPDGLRGPNGPQIFPGLYAVIALMIGNAISSFLQPSIYESIIRIKNYPHLAELPPSRVSVHTLKVERVMIRDVVCITKDTTYKELRDVLIATPNLRSYPLVTDMKSKILLGSVARKYLNYLLMRKLGPDPALLSKEKKKLRTPSDLFGTLRRNSTHNLNNWLTDRNISGNTLLANSPLHDVQRERTSFLPFLRRQSDPELNSTQVSLVDRAIQLQERIDLDEIAIDPAPFQLVLGTSLYKVHTLFSLLALNHAYVTHRGRLVGVISIKELREALADIYTRGAVPTYPVRRSTFSLYTTAENGDLPSPTSNDKKAPASPTSAIDGVMSIPTSSPDTRSKPTSRRTSSDHPDMTIVRMDSANEECDDESDSLLK